MRLYDSPQVYSVLPRFIFQTQFTGLSQIAGCVGGDENSCESSEGTGTRVIGMCVNGVEDGSELNGHILIIGADCNFTAELENCQNSLEHEGDCVSLVGTGLAVQCDVTIDCALQDCSPAIPSNVSVGKPDGDVITCETFLSQVK